MKKDIQKEKGFSRISVVVTTLLVLLALFVGIVSSYIMRFDSELAGENRTHLSEVSQYTVTYMTRVVSDKLEVLKSTATAIVTMDSEQEKMKYLNEIMEQYGFVYVGYADADGLLHATLASQSVDISGEDYFKEAIKGESFVSKYMRKILKDRSASGVVLSVPMENSGSQGVLLAMVDIAKLSETLSLDSFGGDGYSYIFDRNGTIIMRTKSLDMNNIFSAWQLVDFDKGYSYDKAYRDIMANVEGLTSYSYLGVKKYAYYKSLPFNDWTLVNIVSEELISANTNRLITELVAIGIVTILTFIGLMLLAMRSYSASQDSKNATSAKSAFLANMSHEIRTPMNAIVGMSEILLRGDISEKQREQVLSILNSGKGLLTIINDILDISKIEAGKFTIVDDTYELESMLYDITVIAAMRVGEKPVEFLMEIDPSLPRCVVGDMGRLKQILINIIGNAVKFTERGYVKLIISGEKQMGNWMLHFEVRDTGIGIKEEDIGKLFANFNQVDNHRNKNVEGTGLGLSISQKLAEMMEGHITVSSEYNVGSSFIVTVKQGYAGDVPVVSEVSQGVSILVCEPSELLRNYEKNCIEQLKLPYEICNTSEEFQTKVYTGKYTHAIARRNVLDCLEKTGLQNTRLISLFGISEHTQIDSNISSLYIPLFPLQLPYAIMGIVENIRLPKHTGVDSDLIEALPHVKILIVDDNLVNIQVAMGLMEPYGMKMSQALSGERAINAVLNEDFDLILMDHMMPDMSGIEAMKKIRELGDEKYKKLPIVALTANASSDAREMLLAEGFDDFLSKPIETNKLNLVLRKYLKKINSERSTNNKDNISVVINPPVIKNEESIVSNGLEVNFAEGLKQLGSMTIYCKILDTYLNNNLEKLLLFEHWLKTDLERFIIEIHAYKSSSAAVGVAKLSAIAAKMEKQGNEGQVDKIAEAMPDFLRRDSIALEEIRDFLDREAPIVEVRENTQQTAEQQRSEQAENKKHIFVVDDDPVNLDLAESVLSKYYEVTRLSSGGDLLNYLEESIPDMILLDIRMPDMDGYETLRHIIQRDEWKQIPVIFLTGQNDVESERKGFRLGAKDFITKPFDHVVMLSRIASQMELYQYQTELKEIIIEKTGEVEELQHIITVSWAEIIESRDGTTGSHVRNTTSYFEILLRLLATAPEYKKRLASEDKNDLLRASSLHDIGKIGISDLVLKKPGKLTTDEFGYMKRHSTIGRDMIQKIIDNTKEDAFLIYAQAMAYSHHERWDGTGYPQGLKGDEIPFYVQVLAMADVFEALTAVRPYKRAFTFEETMEIMEKDRGTFYCPELFDVFYANRDILKKALENKPKVTPHDDED